MHNTEIVEIETSNNWPADTMQELMKLRGMKDEK